MPNKRFSNIPPGISLLIACTLFLFMGCKAHETNHFPSPKNYDLNHPYKMELPAELNEISGIVYYPKDKSIFAISDATGWLYKIYPTHNLAIKKWKFAKNDDFEDIQLIDSTFYVLGSSGDIFRLKFINADLLKAEKFSLPEKGKNEFESLYYDAENGNLNLLCKDCESDKKKSISMWSFHIQDYNFRLSPVSIDVTIIAKDLGLDKIKIKPSATAIHPVTKELYILSSVNKLLIIADKNGKTKEVYPLNPDIFKQPEGMAFSPEGDLLISNESHETGPANILIFKMKKNK